jgi:hypothetical protein
LGRRLWLPKCIFPWRPIQYALSCQFSTPQVFRPSDHEAEVGLELKSAFRLMTRYKFKKHLNYFHSIGFDTWISFVFILGCYFFSHSFSQVQLLCIIMHFPSLVSTSTKFLHFSRNLPRLRLGGKKLMPYLI